MKPNSKASWSAYWYDIALFMALIPAFWLLRILSAIHRRPRKNQFTFKWIVHLIILYSLTVPYLASCSDPELEVFSVRHRARTQDGEPLPGFRVLENGKPRGQTDETGVLLSRIQGVTGQTITLSGFCPAGYRRSINKRMITLQRLNGLDNERMAFGTEISWQCLSALRATALVVRAATQPHLPIRIRGQHIGQTTADGIAHLLLKEPLGSRFFVTLDTSEYPSLRPQNPRRLFQVADQDAIFIFDQLFSKEKAYKRFRKSPPAPKRYVPYKISH